MVCVCVCVGVSPVMFAGFLSGLYCIADDGDETDHGVDG